MDPSPSFEERRDAFVGRLFQSLLGAEDLLVMYVGDKLGYYRVLADGKAVTSGELAAQTGTHERYAREWLEHQAVGAILDVDDVSAAPEARRYTLPAEHAEVLLDRDSLNYLGAFPRFAAAIAAPMAQLLDAYRTGGGVSWAEYGDDARLAQGDQNRPLMLNLLGKEWLPSIPDIHARLMSDPPARIADVACGLGWSTIAMTRAYPKAQVHGYDIDDFSIEHARKNAAGEGFGDRLQFVNQNIAEYAGGGQYQLITMFEALHDFPQPVEALRAMRGMLAEDGTLFIMDERAAETFTAPGDELERFLYGFSCLC
jgi:hypothetical protein